MNDNEKKVAEQECVLAEVIRELVAFGDGTQRTAIISGYADPDGDRKPVKLKGRTPAGSLLPGNTYQFWGKHETHPQYGPQFVFRHFGVTVTLTRRGITGYLGNLPGIGKVTADRLFDLYGEAAVDRLRDSPEQVAAEAKIRREVAVTAAASLVESKRGEAAKIELIELLHGSGVPERAKAALQKRFGLAAASVIRANPYKLMEFPGVGWSIADSLFLKLGGDPANVERQIYCLQHAAETNDGHIWLPVSTIRESLHRSVSGAKVSLNDCLGKAKARQLVHVREDDSGTWIASRARATQERRFVDNLVEAMTADGPVNWPDLSDDEVLYPHQKEQAAAATRSRVGCLIGSPGCGKTKVLSRMVNTIVSQRLGSFALAAPSGKAAVRISELVSSAGVETTATTIHTLIGARPVDGGWQPLYNKESTLPLDYLFVDEWSMGDIWLGASLTDAISPETHVLYLGDINQLAPVGPGCCLRDMVGGGVPFGELTEPHRNAGAIVHACHDLRKYGRFTPCKAYAPPHDNLVMIPALTAKAQVSAIETLVQKVRNSGKYNPIWDCQVICALNETGDVSRKFLNERMQLILNQDGSPVPDTPYRVGDKVICESNHKAISLDPNAAGADEDGRVYVANGDFGEVEGTFTGGVVVKLQFPQRRIKIFSRRKKDDGPNWSLGYAVTCHKMQGSECPFVFVAIDSSRNAEEMVCDRSWYTTAFSRGMNATFMVGKEATMHSHCQRSNIANRKTFTREMLMEGLAAANSRKLLV